MELRDVMRTTHNCREYRPDPVPDEVFHRAIEAARFAPNGGNRQPVRFLIVRDPEKRRRLGELYLDEWEEPYGAVRAGRQTLGLRPGAHEAANRFAERFAEHPTVIVVCADLSLVRPTDAALDRLSVVGGASIYPMAHNLCLALRDQGVATTFTTHLVEREPEVKELLGIPEHLSTACHLVAGYPLKPFPTRLRRLPVEELAFVESFSRPLRLE
jgi:nitroreductase